LRTWIAHPLVGEAILKITELDADGLRNANMADLLQAQRRIESGRVEGYPLARLGSLPFRPVVDGKVLPVKPYDAVSAGAAAGIPIMAGCTLEEWRLFGALQPAITGLDEANMYKRLGYLIDSTHHAGLVATYRGTLAARGVEPTPPETFMAIQTDRIFRIPALRLLERQRPRQPRLRVPI